MSEYFTISSDAYTEFTRTDDLRELLSSMPSLKAMGPCRYDSAGEDWFTLALVVADHDGSYSALAHEKPEKINCIAATVGAPPASSTLELLAQIAVQLNWTLRED